MDRVKLNQMRVKAQQCGVATSGSKAELFARLTQHYGSEDWIHEMLQDEGEQYEDGSTERESASEVELLRRELELNRREIELYRQEMEVMRRQSSIELRDAEQRENVASASTHSSVITNQTPNLRMIAELICEYDGSPEKYYVWENQLKQLKNSYELSDDAAKIIIGMKLKGKLFEWLHSKAQHMSMTFNELLVELQRMYSPKLYRLESRKSFELRKWKTGESFREYAHDKIILGNRVPIEEDEMMDYLIDGIPDRTLHNQANMQCFKNKENLIEAFDKITLREIPMNKLPRFEKNIASPMDTQRNVTNMTNKNYNQHAIEPRQINCFNCGVEGHLSRSCPRKQSGPRCYKCGGFGHISSKCKRDGNGNQVCVTTAVPSRKCTKLVKIDQLDIEALIDTGSDLSIMTSDIYDEIGSPALSGTNIKFNGIGTSSYSTFGKFGCDIAIDGAVFPICIHVVDSSVCRQKLIIGTNFLSKRNFKSHGGKIYFEQDDNNEIAEIMKIDAIEDDDHKTLDLTHIKDTKTSKSLNQLVSNYKPNKTTDTTVSMKLILKDDQPVYQKA